MDNPKKWFIAAAILLAILCLGGVFNLHGRTKQVAELLGPAAADLGTLQRVRAALRCEQQLDHLTAPVNPEVKNGIFEIPENTSAADIAAGLAESLNISPEPLLAYWTYSGADRALQPGRYVLNGTLTIPQLTEPLTAANGTLITFAFYSGMRLEELAALVDVSGFSFSGSEFLEAAAHYPPSLHPSGLTSLEGYFLPGSYEMSRNISLDKFLANFVSLFNKRIREPYETAFAEMGLSLHEAVIMASMIAREAMSDTEYGTIASVFYNRLQAGMKLESDPTFQYAVGYVPEEDSWWKQNLTNADIFIQSDYNTYVVDGFPAGPICSPSREIYEAVAHPAQTDYYYFRARCDGTPYHNFSRTREEHLSYACP